MGNKKRVTFADLLGFSLVSVVEIAPRSTLKDLPVYLPQRRPVKSNSTPRQHLTCLFEQPVDKNDFVDRIKRQYVCLESVICDKTIIRGFVRVVNVAYNKEVTIRYSTDGWKTVHNETANYLSTSSNGATDTFFFRISLPCVWQDKSKMEFAICYSVEGNNYWDNNNYKNYSVCCSSDKKEE